jgi:hypothetical protein
VQKLKSAQKAFTLGVKAKIGKKKTFHSAPSLLINAELYGLVLAPRLKKNKRIPSKFERPICNPKMLKISPQDFFGP